MSSSTRWLIGVVAVVVIVLGVGVVAAMRSQNASYPADSPEYTVQRYIQAVADRDAGTALSYWSPELTDRCPSFPRESITNRGTSNVQAALESVKRTGSTATVQVQITETYGQAPFGGGESNQTVVFVLIQTPAGWRFSEAPWPTFCPPKPPAP